MMELPGVSNIRFSRAPILPHPRRRSPALVRANRYTETMADLLKCPHCFVLVGPTMDGRCPACGQPIASGGGTPGYVLQIPPQFQSGPTPQSQAARFGEALYASTPRVWVTPTLIAINVVIFVAMLATSMSFSPNPRTVLAWGANFGPKTLGGEWWRLFSAMFLH